MKRYIAQSVLHSSANKLKVTEAAEILTSKVWIKTF